MQKLLFLLLVIPWASALAANTPKDDKAITSGSVKKANKSAVASELVELDEQVVTAMSTSTSFGTAVGNKSLKIDLELRDIPQSLEVRTQQMLKDFGGTQRTDDLGKTVAGVNLVWQGNGGTNVPMFNIRGFPNNADNFKDGYRRTGGRLTTQDLAYVEQVEFLKGPSSLIYGNLDSLGGIVNFVSKRPKVTPIRRIDFTTGQFDFYRGTIDVGDALNQDKSLLYRVNMAFEDGNSFRDFAHHGTQAFALALSYRPNENNYWQLLVDYTQSKLLGDFGLPITPLYQQLPTTLYVQEPNFDHTDVWTLNTTLEYEHSFNAKWKFSLGFSSGLSDWVEFYTRFTQPQAGSFLLPRHMNTEHVLWNNRDFEAKLNGSFNLFAMQHKLLVGMSYLENDQLLDKIRSGGFTDFDMRNPVYGKIDDISQLPEGILVVNNYTLAPYVQDLITLMPKLKLMLGGRYDFVRQYSDKQQFFGVNRSDAQEDAQFTPRAALIYQPFLSTSVYFSYSTSFAQRINNLLDDTQRYKPEKGTQYEFGIKQTVFDTLSLNIAAYELIRSNAVVSDIRKQDRSFQIGEQRSRGLEVDLSGELGEHLRLTASYALTKAEVTRDNVMPAGTERYGVPRHAMSIFGVYHFTEALPGVEIGTGMNYSSKTQAQMPNTFEIDANWQWDAMVNYQLNKIFKVQLNLKNITNERNYVVSADYGYISPLMPRTLSATISANF